MVFDEQTLLDGNIFKYEQRLKSHVNKYIENGALLCTYFSQSENATTVDRGLRDIDQLFGKKSPLRFFKIFNFPLYGIQQLKPDNIEVNNIEDFNVEGDGIILPSTIVPKQFDFFIINHLKMKAVFMITDVKYDSMRVEGYYGIHYKLYSTSSETLENLESQTIKRMYTDLNAVGSDVNPIIEEDDFVLRGKIKQMVSYLKTSYRALFYNNRHNCFLYEDKENNIRLFDFCGNEFISKHSIMNQENSNNVIVLHEKLYDLDLPLHYNNSIYNWIELGSPKEAIQDFRYELIPGTNYLLSTFSQWDEDDINVMIPIGITGRSFIKEYSFFDNKQLNAFLNDKDEPLGSEYDTLIWKYIHKTNTISIYDVPLTFANILMNSPKHIDVFLYTPIIIYIIEEILRMN